MQDGQLDCEGLTRVADRELGALCVRDGAGAYTGAMLGEIDYGFQPVATSSSSTPVGREAGTRYPIGPEMKKELATLAEAAFASTVSAAGLDAASAPGAGVLTVRGQILDAQLEVPQDPDSGVKYLFDTVGRATIVVDLYDSASDELVLRAFDHRESEPQTGDPMAAEAASQMSAIAGLWQAVLADSLDRLPN